MEAIEATNGIIKTAYRWRKCRHLLLQVLIAPLIVACAAEHTDYAGDARPNVPGGGRLNGGQPNGNTSNGSDSAANGSDGGELQVVGFDQVMQKVLSAGDCMGCHSRPSPSAGVLVTSFDDIMAQSGLVTAGNPERSRLYQVIASGEMPPLGRLPSASLEILRQWIVDGAQRDSQRVGGDSP